MIKVAAKLMQSRLSISIASDESSWINSYIPSFMDRLEDKGHELSWHHNINEVAVGDVCFLLGCSQIMREEIRSRNKINLVVHESELPKGKGWSPLTWQILEGKNIIPIKLIEVGKNIDSGKIFLQDQIIFKGTELIEEIRFKQADYSFKLCDEFIEEYPEILSKGKCQEGVGTYYQRRTFVDSKLDVNKSIAEQFNLLRVVDNVRYPAFIEMNGEVYKLKIEKLNDENS